ncbi:TOBE domain-containing protein [Burkholderia sp. LAS2]|uniref:TOBE domain-containing protein n=1 Tax=Burkholderia sp. LAS2 TaxID=2813843 RepID=UPI001BD00C46|nr:TOBE domain-containing protein [Burkholderia sp. LAS2]QVN13444.1 TOBE domain-containing protein [Burkholderia sp. LAS2]
MSITAINVRNQFKGKVKEIIRGSVVSEVDVETPFGIVTSVITTRSVDELELKVGAASHSWSAFASVFDCRTKC